MPGKSIHALLDDYERAAREAGRNPSAADREALRAARAAVNEMVNLMQDALTAGNRG